MEISEKWSGMMVNAALVLKGGPEFRRLRYACTFPRISQSRTLRAILENAKDTEYGREHRFAEILAVRGDEELYDLYRKYNSPSEYEDFRPYVNKMMKGEPDILIKGKPVLYATTSGSSASPKYVPISEIYLRDIYQKMTLMWTYSFMKVRKKTFTGKILTVVGKQSEGQVEDGTPMGSVSNFTGRSAKKFILDKYVIPQEVYSIDDYAARNYVIMRIAIEHNITLYLTPNPSTVVELQNVVDRSLDDFIEDIGNGTLSAKVPVPENVRAAVEPLLRPNPDRAFQLRALQSQYDRVLPRHYWPEFQTLVTWKCGNTSIYLKQMSDFFPEDAAHMELGYFSTECRAGLAVEEGIDSVPMPHMHFYEFKREKDLDDPDGQFYNIYELKEGERYCPFVTTFSGLYRYNMNDIIQIGPAFINTPTFHMIRKVNGIVSITGEKLYEEQFIMAVDQAQESTGLKLKYYTGYVNLEKSRYDWYFEFENRRMNQKRAQEFAAVVDENLKKLNIEYESKRNSFRLKSPSVYLLEPDAFEKFKAFILNINHRDASRFKPNVLAQNEELHSVMDRFRKRVSSRREDRKGSKKKFKEE